MLSIAHAMIKLSKTSSHQKLFDYDCVTLYSVQCTYMLVDGDTPCAIHGRKPVRDNCADLRESPTSVRKNCTPVPQNRTHVRRKLETSPSPAKEKRSKLKVSKKEIKKKDNRNFIKKNLFVWLSI